VLELDEDEGGLGDVADLAGAEHDALERTPALGHQGEAPLAQAAQRAQQRVAGAGVNIGFPPARRPSHRDVNAAAWQSRAWRLGAFSGLGELGCS
jgi:hypothetical protein